LDFVHERHLRGSVGPRLRSTFKMPEAAGGQAAQLCTCDIPDQGGYHKGPSFDGDVTSADADKLLAG
jgi:hypothetical protein